MTLLRTHSLSGQVSDQNQAESTEKTVVKAMGLVSVWLIFFLTPQGSHSWAFRRTAQSSPTGLQPQDTGPQDRESGPLLRMPGNAHGHSGLTQPSLWLLLH